MTNEQPIDDDRITVHIGWQATMIGVSRHGYEHMPPLSLHLHLSNGHVYTYLTLDEAALLGKTLLDAATDIARSQRADDDMERADAEALKAIEDAVAAPKTDA